MTAVEQRPAPPMDARRPPRLAWVRRHRRWLFALVVVALLAEMATAMVVSAAQETPTTDEPVYVGAAVAQMQQHSLQYNFEHPPLGKLIMEAGLVFAHPRLDPAFHGDQWDLGDAVLYHSGNDPWRLMFLARLPMIIMTLLFGLVVFGFARDLVGPGAAVAALALYAFDPDLIAHGSLATLDVTGAGFVLLSAWLLWRSRDRPGRYVPLAGAAMGAALATRTSAFPAVPVLVVLVVLSVWRRGRSWRALGRGVAAAAGFGAIAVAVVWLVYLVVDPSLRFSAVTEDVPQFGGLHGLFIDAMPFPRPFRDGLAVQFGFEQHLYGGFLFGRDYSGSLWYYQPVALTVKTPLGMLALWLGGTVAMLSIRTLRPAIPYVLVPAAVLFLATLGETRNFGTRYVIFLPMFLSVAAATVLAVRRRWVVPLTAALVLYVAVSSLRTFPYYIPYSNEAYGGPSKTYLRLHDSNSDWGQDLGRAAKLVRERYPGEPVWVFYQGGGDPAWYGIGSADPTKVPPDRVHGILVVSDDRIDKSTFRLRTLLASSTKIATVGHSMTIFRR